jgi:hypothetical protein
MNQHLFEPDGIANAWMSVYMACQHLGIKEERTETILSDLICELALDDLQKMGNFSDEEFDALDDKVVDSHLDRYYDAVHKVLEDLPDGDAESSETEQGKGESHEQ